MQPELRFVLPCACGAKNRMAASQAGSTLPCVQCGSAVRVPGLSALKQLASVDISPLGQLVNSIRMQKTPFDGNCQSCQVYSATILVPVRLVVISKDGEHFRAVNIPCVFCDMCVNEFRRGLWWGRLKTLQKAGLGAIWLLIAFIAASIVAFILPFVGLFFVLAVLSGLFYQLTRRRANPYLLRHLNRVCKLSEALKDVEEYDLTTKRMQRIDN